MTQRGIYRRTPLPQTATTPLGWFAVLWLWLIFSPFLGFALAGRVGVPGLNLGVALALVPLGLLAVLAMRRWVAWQRLPPQLANEWREGRVLVPEGAPAVMPPVAFAHGQDRMEFTTHGVLVAQHSVLGVQPTGDARQLAWVLQQAQQLHVPWADVAEWVVDTDCDGPDDYRLVLRAGGRIRLRRFLPDAHQERQLLDAVRSIGKRPVRLLCDVD